MRVVGIAEPRVNEARIVYCSHLVEVVIGSFGELNGLLFGIQKIFRTPHRRLVEIKNAEIIKTAKNVVMNLGFGELGLGGKGIRPGNVKVFDNISVLWVPIKVLGNEPSIPDVHFDECNIFVDGFDVGPVG